MYAQDPHGPYTLAYAVIYSIRIPSSFGTNAYTPAST
jgi:hypothetical protein